MCSPPSLSPTSGRDARVGCTLPGGYVIQELIGTGGMACVYRAEQTALGRTVAVKIVHSHLVGDEGTAKRFIREARAASRLNHPHSMAVIDFGRMDDGQYYLVMEYLRGRDLARVVAEEGPLEIRRVINIVRQLLDALSEAHQLGIVHRDLKPENIVVEQLRTGEDFIKVVDFGLAKLFSQNEDLGITAAGTVCGTPDYMSPEQCRGDPLDPRSDLYSVGVNLFVLLTGRLPFEAPTPTQALLLHLTAAPPDPRTVAPSRNIPQALVDITWRAMAKNRADRFQSAQEFAEALAEVDSALGAQNHASAPPELALARCPVCDAPVLARSKFCGECGTPLRGDRLPKLAESVPDDAPGTSPTPARPRADNKSLVGRDAELASLLGALQSVSRQLEVVRIVGEPGIGRTRLLQELAARASRRGFTVAHVLPDPWRAQVTWFALRSAVARLAALPDHGGQPSHWSAASHDARAGLSLLFHRDKHDLPLPSSPSDVRRHSRAALRWAIDAARSRSSGQPVILLIDDLESVDGASRNAFSDVLREGDVGGLFVVATHAPAYDPRWPDTSAPIQPSRLDRSSAMAMVDDEATQSLLESALAVPVTPLFVSLAVRFVENGGGPPPASLGDLVAALVARLSRHQRRVLQSVAVLGDGARTDQIARLLVDGSPVHHAARELVASGLLQNVDASFQMAHPLLRDLVLSTMPSAVARQLHESAADLAAQESLPAEVRARFALGAGDAFGALLLLDRVGALAMQCDDADGAVDFFRRGFAYAKAEIGRGELDDPRLAVVMFGRKLGDALTAARRYAEAEPILREILQLAEPSSTERARILLSLARIAGDGRRVAEAARLRHDAAAVALDAGDDRLADEIRRMQP